MYVVEIRSGRELKRLERPSSQAAEAAVALALADRRGHEGVPDEDLDDAHELVSQAQAEGDAKLLEGAIRVICCDSADRIVITLEVPADAPNPARRLFLIVSTRDGKPLVALDASDGRQIRLDRSGFSGRHRLGPRIRVGLEEFERQLAEWGPTDGKRIPAESELAFLRLIREGGCTPRSRLFLDRPA